MLTWIDRLFIVSKSSCKVQAAGEGCTEGGQRRLGYWQDAAGDEVVSCERDYHLAP